jgi:hypothetical protein
MKTKTLLLLCFYLCVAATQLSAQQTRTYPEVITVSDNDYDLYIICDGAVVDILNYPDLYSFKGRVHYKDGEMKWFSDELINAQFTSAITGEVFKGQSIENSFENGHFNWHLHLNGNMGNHYNIRMVYDTATWTLLEYHSTCH